jgi:acyl-CoA dehydrogenase
MDLTLPPEDLAWHRRAKAFAETVLFPHELELEMNGSLPRATKDALRKAVVTHGFNGINHACDLGGQGCSHAQTVAATATS